MKFEEANLNDNIKRAVKEIGFENMTAIQENTITPILNHKDIVAMSNTGSGKTAAFLLPLIENINPDEKSTKVLVLTPTRELAIQIVSEARKFSKYLHSINSIAIYGGQDIKMQSITLRKGIKIVVGTPGRILDLLKKKSLKIQNLDAVVLDEADEMLSMGFEKEIDEILEYANDSAQKLLFSATINDRVKSIASKRFNHPEYIECKENSTLVTENVRQIAVECKEKMKFEATLRIIKKERAKNSIIFCNTKKKTEEVGQFLRKNRIKLEVLNSDIRQEEREKIFKKLKRGELDTIVVTDVLARGIDVEDLELVINYDIPIDKEYYVHRIGRTARNGKSGVAYIFYTGKQQEKLEEIEEYIQTKFVYEDIPLLNEEINVEKIEYPLNERGYYVVKISLGKNDSVKAKDIVGAMKAMVGIPSDKIGMIEVKDDITTVEIPKEYIVDVDKKFTKCKIKEIDAHIIK